MFSFTLCNLPHIKHSHADTSMQKDSEHAKAESRAKSKLVNWPFQPLKADLRPLSHVRCILSGLRRFILNLSGMSGASAVSSVFKMI